jgi:hypothetical protein
MEIQAIRTPLAKQLYRGFTDLVSVERNYIAILANLEKTFGTGKVGGTNFGTINVLGETKLNFRYSEPEWEGFDWNNSDISGMRGEPKTATKVAGMRMLYPSGYRLPSEAFSEIFVQTLETDEATSTFMEDTYTGIKDGVYARWEEDLFPTNNELDPTVAGGVAGEDTISKVLAFGHVFQSGGVGNNTPTTETFNYLGVNFNDARWPGIKAIVSGSGPTLQQTQAGLTVTNSPFGVPANSNLRTKIYFPMSERKADADLIFTDALTMDYLINDPESRETKNSMKAMETFSYGGMYRILPNGQMVFLINNMTKLFNVTGVHKIYFAKRDQIYWGMHNGMPTMSVVPLELNPGFSNIQGYTVVKHLIKNGRQLGLAYNVNLS